MKGAAVFVMLLLLGATMAFSNVTPAYKVDALLPSDGAESGYAHESPPPIDSICLVFAGVDYGANFNSPQAYPNAKHITNVNVGSYYFPVSIWETGDSWGKQSLFSYWDDLFKFWSYPDSFTSNQSVDTGRPNVCSDGYGDLHFCWHQTGSPDGYETFYTRALIDTSSGVIQYNVERPAQFISVTDGTEARFPSLGIYNDTLIMAVFDLGRPVNAIGYNYSTDGGTTWAGQALAYDPGGLMDGSWIQPCVAMDPSSGDAWATFCYDASGDGSMDLCVIHWDASSNTWTFEVAGNATSMHPYAVPAIACDYNGVPHIVFQENLTTTGGSGGLSGWNGCGPAGTLYYTHKQTGTWSTPVKIIFPFYTQRSYCAGYPSGGLAAMDNGMYFSCTIPESASSDTGAYLPFNVHYGEISGYGSLSDGGKVSNLPWADTTNAIYPHIVANVPADGPGITWSQMVNALPPSDIFYNHSDTLLGIAEDEKTVQPHFSLYQNLPNPFSNKTVIRFSIGQRAEGNLTIYDVAGRLVREWNLHSAYSILPTGIVWDGKDLHGDEVPGGIYLYTLTSGASSETKKLILLR